MEGKEGILVLLSELLKKKKKTIEYLNYSLRSSSRGEKLTESAH